MTSDEISIRRWQELYRTGAFAQDAGELAGWDDFNDPLADRKVQTLVKLVMGMTHPLILDDYRVHFIEHHPGEGPRYGSVCFYPLTGKWSEGMFSVGLNCPFSQNKWVLFTRRYGEGETEFECGHIRSMIRYIHTMADELEQGIKPTFWPELEAAKQFFFEYLPGCAHLVPRREGEHSYSAWDRITGRRVTLHVSHRPEDVPPGFQAQDAVPVCGLYVYCPEDVRKSLPDLQRAEHKSHKKKEVER